jgi:hypothetical protein
MVEEARTNSPPCPRTQASEITNKAKAISYAPLPPTPPKIVTSNIQNIPRKPLNISMSHHMLMITTNLIKYFTM